MAQLALDEWSEDHAQRAKEELTAKVMLDGLQRMQDRIRDEQLGQMGERPPASSQAGADRGAEEEARAVPAHTDAEVHEGGR
jgi:hypothetical protein